MDQVSYTATDVILVRGYLVQLRLPIELADIILDEARYWVRFLLGSKEEQHVVAAGLALDTDANDVIMYYLVTGPIPGSVGGYVPKPRATIFTIVSHDKGCSDDQGYANERQWSGTYGHSLTWFEAVIFKPEDDHLPPEGVSTTLVVQKGLAAPSYGVTNPHETSGRWLLQRNIRGVRAYIKHVVMWDRELRVLHDEAGNGGGRGFVERLESGSRIGVAARAKLRGWENHVTSVVVEVFAFI